jgi:hypothetical protein
MWFSEWKMVLPHASPAAGPEVLTRQKSSTTALRPVWVLASLSCFRSGCGTSVHSTLTKMKVVFPSVDFERDVSVVWHWQREWPLEGSETQKRAAEKSQLVLTEPGLPATSRFLGWLWSRDMNCPDDQRPFLGWCSFWTDLGSPLCAGPVHLQLAQWPCWVSTLIHSHTYPQAARMSRRQESKWRKIVWQRPLAWDDGYEQMTWDQSLQIP